jgi:hypothetical protein
MAGQSSLLAARSLSQPSRSCVDGSLDAGLEAGAEVEVVTHCGGLWADGMENYLRQEASEKFANANWPHTHRAACPRQ